MHDYRRYTTDVYESMYNTNYHNDIRFEDRECELVRLGAHKTTTKYADIPKSIPMHGPLLPPSPPPRTQKTAFLIGEDAAIISTCRRRWRWWTIDDDSLRSGRFKSDGRRHEEWDEAALTDESRDRATRAASASIGHTVVLAMVGNNIDRRIIYGRWSISDSSGSRFSRFDLDRSHRSTIISTWKIIGGKWI